MSAAPGPLLLGDADCTGLHLLHAQPQPEARRTLALARFRAVLDVLDRADRELFLPEAWPSNGSSRCESERSEKRDVRREPCPQPCNGPRRLKTRS